MASHCKKAYTIVENIADEYEVGEGLLLLFSSRPFQRQKEIIKDTMTACGYQILDKHVYEIVSKDQVETALKNVVDEYGHVIEQNFKCLIVFFLGRTINEKMDSYFTPEEKLGQIMFHDIWSRFLNFQIPKIFIMQSHFNQLNVAFDSMPFKVTDLNIPYEADTTIIFKVIEDTKDTFIEDLCENIKKYSKRDDLFELILRTNQPHGSSNPPIVLSTFLRRFYFGANANRGYFYDIMNSIREINDQKKNCVHKDERSCCDHMSGRSQGSPGF